MIRVYLFTAQVIALLIGIMFIFVGAIHQHQLITYIGSGICLVTGFLGLGVNLYNLYLVEKDNAGI